MKETNYYFLRKPERDIANPDPADIEDLNHNADIIDAELKSRADALEAHRSAETLDHPAGSVTAGKIAAGAVTDEKIGDRTIGTVTAKLQPLLSALGEGIKGVKGTDDWTAEPAVTLAGAAEALSGLREEVDANTAASHTHGNMETLNAITSLEQSGGDSQSAVMSQKAVTDAIAAAGGALPAGGAQGDVLTKASAADNDVEWAAPSGGSGDILQKVYPVGSIYLSVSGVNPGGESVFGFGTWELWGSGRVPVGVQEGSDAFGTAESTGGEYEVTLSAEQMPTHSHTVTTGAESAKHTHTSGIHTHTARLTYDTAAASNNILADAEGRPVVPVSGKTGSYVLIDAGKANSTGGTAVTINSNTATHTHSGTTSQTGSGQAHGNMQPYITCYMWKRTA